MTDSKRDPSQARLTFSQRIGIEPLPVLQLTSMTTQLRMALRNAIYPLVTKVSRSHIDYERLNEEIWCNLLHKSLRDPFYPMLVDFELDAHLTSCAWNSLIESIEFILKHAQPPAGTSYVISQGALVELQSVAAKVNSALEVHHSGYRLLDMQFVPITSPVDLEAISHAQQVAVGRPSQVHLEAAITALKHLPEPDLRNCIKEAISAVESQTKSMVERLNLGNVKGDGLAEPLTAVGKALLLDGALIAGFKSLYGWTSNTNGIRHGLKGESNLELEDAVYMLVTCSAFVSYLVAKEARLVQRVNVG